MNEEKAFLVMLGYDDKEYTYFIKTESAFTLARTEAKIAYICIGADRYAFINGEPLLDFAKEKAS